jgi:hypothetical protein
MSLEATKCRCILLIQFGYEDYAQSYVHSLID